MLPKKKSAKKKKANPITSTYKATIQELQASRDGGQIALKGFSYQFLYSCFLILSEMNCSTVFHLEGIEDIDQIKYGTELNDITHIQIKYSKEKQDASFLKDVLKNFIEAYLLDKSRSFKLVYDFSVAKGNLSKLFSNTLDDASTLYWRGVVEVIQIENPCWNWSGFIFEDFITMLAFEKVEESGLAKAIEGKLIESYDIVTGNANLYANGIKVCCLEKMKRRESLDKSELDALIQDIQDDISKGVQNPAHGWIKRVIFDIDHADAALDYYEGKKATPQDIVRQLPVRRVQLEREIKESIQENRVTVIKASSGQGKTTMALQVAYDLQDEYKVYQLSWCNDAKELGNIVRFFGLRVKRGEKPLILIDNLDSQLAEWNRLAQLLQDEVTYHYKLLITTREDDWYSHGGNLSNVRSLQIIKPALNEEEAQNIYDVLSGAQKIHSSISCWQKSWSKVSDKKLLIEYVYLLTHGEMLSERIANQITQINKTNEGKVKCEILRLVCFADVCGIRLLPGRIMTGLSETTAMDYGELLKSIENEFLIRVNTAERYIEGLHPVRSQHIVDALHEFVEISETALQVAQIADASYLPKLFSKLPQLITNKSSFYAKFIDVLWNSDDLSCYVLALQGLFSGSVAEYFLRNQNAFDDANDHGGLFLMATELSPFTKFKEFDRSLDGLDNMSKILPDSENLQFLCNLRDNIPRLILADTDIYCFCEALFTKLKDRDLFGITDDVPSYSSIAYWLINIERTFNLSPNILLEAIWENKAKYSVAVLSSIMYTCFCGNKESYMNFVTANLPDILLHLRAATQSLRLYTDKDKNEIHVEYILLPSEIKKGNKESVSRLQTICKALPIFDTYCANSIKPTIDALSSYKIPDDSKKAMPIENLVITFHQEFNSLWLKTIMSNYEFDSVLEWLEHWFSVRRDLATLFQAGATCMYRLLERKPLGAIAKEFDTLKVEVNKKLIREYKYPSEERPFEEKAKIPEGLSKITRDYFGSAQNFLNQFIGFLRRDANDVRLALVNLQAAQSSLGKMQSFFENASNEQCVLQQQHSSLCIQEEQGLQSLMMTCMYYKEHQPSEFFDKYQIKSWYEKNYELSMGKAEQSLCGLSMYDVVFPASYYYIKTLNYYPIIISNLDTADSESLGIFFLHCAPFSQLNFDYLVVVFKDDQGRILPRCFLMSNDFLRNLQTIIETGNEALAEKVNPPFPQEITAQMLECFNHQYEVVVPVVAGYEGLDRVAELLWAFSMTRKGLGDGNDPEYQRLAEDKLKTQVLDALRVFKHQVSRDYYDEVSQLCKAVFNGRCFDDTDLNLFCDRLINGSALR